jgi:hypothetical protein
MAPGITSHMTQTSISPVLFPLPRQPCVVAVPLFPEKTSPTAHVSAGNTPRERRNANVATTTIERMKSHVPGCIHTIHLHTTRALLLPDVEAKWDMTQMPPPPKHAPFGMGSVHALFIMINCVCRGWLAPPLLHKDGIQKLDWVGCPRWGVLAKM